MSGGSPSFRLVIVNLPFFMTPAILNFFEVIGYIQDYIEWVFYRYLLEKGIGYG
jgi:hypothetical protein